MRARCPPSTAPSPAPGPFDYPRHSGLDPEYRKVSLMPTFLNASTLWIPAFAGMTVRGGRPTSWTLERPCTSTGAVGKGFGWGYNESHADVAQPEEQRFRKPQVKGSSPFIGSTFSIRAVAVLGSVSINRVSTDFGPFCWTNSQHTTVSGHTPHRYTAIVPWFTGARLMSPQ